METPDNAAGRMTEEIMAGWLARLDARKEPRPSTATYNAAYESVYATLDMWQGEYKRDWKDQMRHVLKNGKPGAR